MEKNEEQLVRVHRLEVEERIFDELRFKVSKLNISNYKVECQVGEILFLDEIDTGGNYTGRFLIRRVEFLKKDGDNGTFLELRDCDENRREVPIHDVRVEVYKTLLELTRVCRETKDVALIEATSSFFENTSRLLR